MYSNARKHGLLGTDAMVYEALVYLCKHSSDGTCKISTYKLAEFSCCGCDNTASRSLQRLIGRGLVLQNGANFKEERTKEENINIKEVVVKDNNTPTFFDFFNLFSPNGEFKSYEKACKKIWDKIPQDWRQLAIQKARDSTPGRNPYYFLADEDFLRVGPKNETTIQKPTWLTGEEIDAALRAGIPLAVCRNPETNLFGTVTKEHAEQFKLTIKRTM